jgi:PilZ domain
MAEENNGGVPYLQALRRLAGSGTATAATPARSPISPATSGGGSGTVELPSGVDQRRSPRYKCEGSVELRASDSEVRTWAQFTDISMHGCYVEATTTYPVGTAVHMKLEANGFQVHTQAEVRATYPSLGMGIAFTDTPQEDGGRLRELLKTISRPSVIMGAGAAATQAAAGPRDSAPVISDPGAAIRALVEFFENRHMLMREDFLRMLRKSQGER